MTRHKSNDRILIIDWIKAICIILVILNHSELFDRENNVFFLLIIDIAVPVFMILSGYTFAYKYSKSSIIEMFEVRGIVKRVIRFTIPMIFAYIAYLLYLNNMGELTVHVALSTFLKGEYGKGAYYYSLMIEFIVIAPFILILIRANRKWGLVIVAAINFLYDVSCRIVNLSPVIYRILLFRYLTMIACGMYIFYLVGHSICEQIKLIELVKKEKVNLVLMIAGYICGIIYKLMPCLGYSYKLFRYGTWGRTSMISALYVAPMVCVLLLRFQKINICNNALGQILQRIGKASYHIMYTQMVYYVFVFQIHSKYIEWFVFNRKNN